MFENAIQYYILSVMFDVKKMNNIVVYLYL